MNPGFGMQVESDAFRRNDLANGVASRFLYNLESESRSSSLEEGASRCQSCLTSDECDEKWQRWHRQL